MWTTQMAKMVPVKEQAKAEFIKAEAESWWWNSQFICRLIKQLLLKNVQSLKQSIEKTLRTDNVVIDVHHCRCVCLLLPCLERTGIFQIMSSWSPDKIPSTYLVVIKPGGENTKTTIGFDGTDNATNQEKLCCWFGWIYQAGWPEAGAEKQGLNKRYENMRLLEESGWLIMLLVEAA